MTGQADRPQELLSLPEGGGALSGIGEAFTPDPHTGTANLSIPLPLPAGRNGFGPKVSLAYTSGAGNGPFGLGWNLDVPAISRKTSLGVPVYDDNTDVFVQAGGEDLVPVGSPAAGVTRYRPRTEGAFSYIDHYSQPGSDYWQVRSKDGLTSIYGTPGSAGGGPAVITDPADQTHIFSWRQTLTTDPFGNRIEYLHARDQVREDGPHSWDQLYLSEIRYVDYGQRASPSFLISARFRFASRPDPFSDYRAGFEIRTIQRCTSIEIDSDTGTDVLARELSLTYADQQPDATAPHNNLSLLAKVQVTGHDGTATESLPPVTFDYTAFLPAGRQFAPVGGGTTPIGVIAGSDHELIDLLGRGLPDVVQLNGTAQYWRNLGQGHWAPPQTIPDAPAGVQLGQPGVRFADANGDGHLDLMVSTATTAGYYPWSYNGSWDSTSYRPFPVAPSFSLTDPLVHLVDLTGNGVTDAIRSGSCLECFFCDPDAGWTSTRFVEPGSLAVFPDVSFADPRVTWADMTGDGQQDIVYVHDRIVQYWPNLGHGNWGKQITMASCPALPFNYDPTRVLVGDIDGDGAADLVYIGGGQVTIWINRSGNSWSEPITIDGTPLVSNSDLLRLIDLFGNGVPGLLFSATDTATPSGRPGSWYLEFTGGVKPYMLSRIDNHIGAITTLTFASSTSYCLQDGQQAATAWQTTLPFPVQVLAKTESIDAISGGRLTTSYSYHNGYWDGVDHEFRGFGRVDQTDTETVDLLQAAPPTGPPGLPQLEVPRWCPPVQTRTWYHLGPVGDAINWTELDCSSQYWPGDPVTLTRPPAAAAFLAALPGPARRDAIRTLRGRVLRSEVYWLDGTPRQGNPYTVTENALGVSGLPVGSAWPANPQPWQLQVFYPETLAARTTQWERGSDPLTRLTFTDTFDSYGQPTATISASVPRGRDYTAPGPASPGSYLATYVKTVYAQRDDAEVFITDRTARTTSYEAINDGTTSLWALHAAILSGTAELRLFAQTGTYYDGTAFTGLPLGQLGHYGAAVRTETLAFDDAIIDAAYASGSTVTSPPERPPYLPADAGGSVTWTPDYPAEFRSVCPPLAGFVWNPGGADPDDHPGYFSEASRKRFDFHTPSGAEGPPGTGVGLLQVSRDPLGNDTTIARYDPYQLEPVQVVGPTGLVTFAEYDYRVLQLRQLTSPNGNVSQCAFTPLGLLASVAVMGKPGQDVGDTPAAPSLRYAYDLSAFDDPARRVPISVRTIRRVYHITDTAAPAADLNDTRQLVEYSDGFSRKIQVRTDAADLTIGDPVSGDSGLPLDPTKNADAIGRQRSPGDPPNVAVTGWVIYDNKNHIIRSYEPFYSTGFGYAVPAGPELGRHQDLYYDPIGRNIRTVNPDGSETLVVYGVPGTINVPDLTNPAVFEPTPWEIYTYDPNDNAGRTSPVQSLPYQSHWNTPASSVTDALGRITVATVRNGPNPATDWYSVRTGYDIRGNILSVTDALGRVTYQRCYDYANRCLRISSLDAGIRRTIPDAAGSAVEGRASNGSLTLAAYDQSHRPIRAWARDTADAAVTLRELLIYGESGESGLGSGTAAALNLLGQVYQHYDEAGRATLLRADFKTNPLDKIREVVSDSLVAGAAPFAIDWQPPAGSDLATHANNLLDTGTPYETSLSYNALDQLVATQAPVTVDGVRHVIQPYYDRAGAVMAVSLDRDTFVSLATYNARGQPTMTVYGNGLMTRQAYDPVTFRIARVRTERFILSGLDYHPTGPPVEDRLYSYDLFGNILEIQDRTPGSGVLANPGALSTKDHVLAGLLASGDALLRDFSYDPVYQLVSATGRECASIPVPRPVTDDPRCGYNSGAFGSLNQDNAPSMTNLYTERYSYDPIGDLVTLAHSTAAASWTRDFGFGGLQPEDWQTAWTSHLNSGTSWVSPPTTWLTHLSNDPTAGTPTYSYDLNGNLTGITTSRHLDWTHDDRLGCYRDQVGSAAPTMTATYFYNSSGNRTKKIVTRGPVTESTAYVDGLYEHLTHTRASGTIEQNTLHVMIGSGRVATVRIGTPLPDDVTPATKYVLADHLETAVVVLDETGSWVNREEYSPYGETVLGSYAHKRYRYAGRERDEESGLDYSQARYYASWLARWISADPLTVQSLASDFNPYRYSGNHPLNASDPSGLGDQIASMPPATSESAGSTACDSSICSVVEDDSASAEPAASPAATEPATPPAPPCPNCHSSPDKPGISPDMLHWGTGTPTAELPAAPQPPDPIGESGVRLKADVPREHYDSVIARDLAAQGYLNLAEIVEAGHGCAFCHIVKNYATLREANAAVDLAHYNTVATLLNEANTQLAIQFAGEAGFALASDAIEMYRTRAAAEGALTMNSSLESGATVRHSPTATAIGDDASTVQNFARSRGAAGHDVIVHGDMEGNFRVNGMITHPQQIADAIWSNPDYRGGPINLATCFGARGAAQELGGIMGVPINASPHLVDLDPLTGLLREFPRE
jgi:RHS repeat-associated protein